MIDYAACLLKAYPGITEDEYSLSDDGNGITLSWTRNGEPPTLSELETFWLAVCMDVQCQIISNTAQDELDNGTSGYKIIGVTPSFVINSSRSDLDNLKNYLDYCTRNNITIPVVRAKDNSFHQITLVNLIDIVYELQTYGLWIYQNKWNMQTAVMACVSVDQVVNINFWS